MSTTFKPTISYPSLFKLSIDYHSVYVVYDIIVTSFNPLLTQNHIDALSNCFSLKDLSNLNNFLGVEVILHSDGLFLTQSKYIHDILIKTNMHNIYPLLLLSFLISQNTWPL